MSVRLSSYAMYIQIRFFTISKTWQGAKKSNNNKNEKCEKEGYDDLFKCMFMPFFK